MNLYLIPWSLAFLATANSAGAAEFYSEKIDDKSQGIIITGEIERGDDEEFRQLTIQHPDAWVVLDSPGGALIPALEIGRLIRLREYATVVLDKDICTSSCALMWLAGERRFIQGTGGVGFHASYIDEAGRKVESGIANALVGHYLSQLGLSQRAAIFATKASPDQITWLTNSNKIDAGIEFTDIPSENSATKANVRAKTSPPIEVVVTPPPVPIYRQAQAKGTEDIIREQFRAPGVAESGARAIGASGALISPITVHLRLIYENDAIIERVAQEIDAAKIDVRKNPEVVGPLLFRFSTNSVWKGMTRLPQRDVNLYFKYLSEVTIRDDINCSLSENTGRVNIREFESISRLGGNHLQSYLALVRKAMFAEAENFPSVVVIDASQKEIAESAWAEIIVETVNKRGDAEAARLLAIIQNYDAAKPQEKCEVNKLMIPEVARMKGLAGDWFRRTYLTYVIDAL